MKTPTSAPLCITAAIYHQSDWGVFIPTPQHPGSSTYSVAV